MQYNSGFNVNPLRRSDMGATALRDDELEFIESKRVSAEIRRINDGSHGAMARAARRVEELYREKFSGVLPGETDADFSARRAIKKNAKRLVAETEEARDARLAKIGQVSSCRSRP